jgi:hypothetical protein
MLRIILERVAGDLELHPDTWIMCAGNLPEQCPAGQEIDSALGNRLLQIDFRPTLAEVCAYMRTLGEPGSSLRAAATQWAATAAEDGQLVQFDPPEESIQSGASYASPRTIEGGLRTLVECQRANLPAHLQRAALTAAWGEGPAARYWGILQYAEFLPTSAEICKDPATAKLPEKTEHQIAAFGVVNLAATIDGWAAWIYTDRLPDEIAARISRQLLADNVVRTSKMSKKSKHAKAGAKAMQRRILANQKAMKGAI